MLTFQYTSEYLTPQIMQDIGFEVNELVTTRDTAVKYAYVHLKRRVRGEELGRAICTLESRGVRYMDTVLLTATLQVRWNTLRTILVSRRW